jgi:hypothetical protein
VRIWSIGAVVAGVVLLVAPGGSGAAAAAASGGPSAKVLVIPGFTAPHYSGTSGVPRFPVGTPGLAGYAISELGSTTVTASALQGYDTVVVYGLRWSTLSPRSQSAINAFAQTGKVIIWDADATGSQDYGSFVVPFSTTASGENPSSTGAVVSFPVASNPLASPDPASPLYLDPASMIASNHLIEHMSVLNPDAPGWTPALIAANHLIPNAGWVLAWAYGSAAAHTGMVIYSGMDADAFSDQVTPNYALKELAIELAAPSQAAADSGCAPNCSPPPVPGGSSSSSGSGTGGAGSGGSGGSGSGSGSSSSGLGSTGLPTFASCSLALRPPVSWVRGRITLPLTTSVADGITGQVVTQQGKIVGAGVPTAPGQLRLVVNTLLLPSNRASKLLGVVYVNSAKACTVSTSLKVDNTPPRLLLFKLRGGRIKRRLILQSSERAALVILAGKRTLQLRSVPARSTVTILLPGRLRSATLELIDRAGNRTIRSLTWH